MIEARFVADWSQQRGVIAIRWNEIYDPESEDGYLRFNTLRQFFEWVPEGSTIILERTFESYDLEERQLVLKIARERNLDLKCTPTRATWRTRKRLWPEVQSDHWTKISTEGCMDRYDVLAIREIAKTAHLIAGEANHRPPADELKRQDVARYEIMKARNTANKRQVGGKGAGKVTETMKDAKAKEVAASLPNVPDWAKPYLRTKTGWRLSVIAAIAIAKENTLSKKEFERLIGMYHHAYPNQFRSDLMFHAWHKYIRKEPGTTLSEFRKAVRWLYHNIK